MQVCPQCYRETEDGQRFCGACGYQLNNTCPDCGFNNLPDQVFCGQCGLQILSASSPEGDNTGGQETVRSVEIPSQKKSNAPAPEHFPFDESMAGISISLPSLQDIEGYREERHQTQQDTEAFNPEVIPNETLDITPPSLDEILSNHSDINTPQTVGILIEITEHEGFEDKHFAQAQQIIGDMLSQHNCTVFFTDHDIVQGRIVVQSTQEFQATASNILQSVFQLLTVPLVVDDLTCQLRAGLEIAPGSILEFDDDTAEIVPGLEACSAAATAQILLDSSIASLLESNFSLAPVTVFADDGFSQTFYTLAQGQEAPASPPIQESSNPSAYSDSAPPTVQLTAETSNDSSSSEVQDYQSVTDYSAIHFEPVHFEPERYIIVGEKTPANTDYEQAVASLFDEYTAINQPEAQGKVVQLLAEEGLGKSYILNISRSLVDPETNQNMLWLGAHHYHSPSLRQLPLMTWFQLFYNTMGLIPEGHALEDVQAQVTAFLNYLCEGQIPEHFQSVLHDLLSVSPVTSIAELTDDNDGRLENFLFDLLTLMSQSKPLVIVLDNLHHADQPSLGLLARLLKRGLLNNRILLITAYTPDCKPSGSLAEALKKVNATELSIGNLTRVEMDRFLNDGPFGGQIEQYPIAFLENLYKYSEGKPLYLEEALRWLHLKDYLTTDPNTSKFTVEDPEYLLSATLPAKVDALISQRVEILEDEARYLLQLASVLGECFSISMLQALSQQEQNTFNECLEHLYNHGLIQPDATNTGRFRHGKIWNTTYKNIPPSLRQQFHQLVSEALENDVSNHVTVSPYIRAYHAINGQLINRAIHYLAMTGAQVNQLGNLEGTNLTLHNAIEFFQHLDPDKREKSHLRLYAQILEDIALINLHKNPEQSITVMKQVRNSYTQHEVGDSALLLESLGILVTAYENTGNYTEAQEVTDDMLDMIDANQYPMESVTVQSSKLEQLYKLGKYQEGLELYQSVIAPVLEPQLDALSGEQRFVYYNARLQAAAIMLEQLNMTGAEWINKTLDNDWNILPPPLTIAYRLLRGKALINQGQYDECDKEADALLNDIEQLDNPDWYYAQWGLLALEYHMAKGDWENARSILITVIDKSNDARDYLTALTAETWASYLTYKHGGDPVEALKQLNDAILKSSEYRFATTALLGWQLMSEIHFELGHHDEANNLIENALDIAKKDVYQHKKREYELILLKAKLMVAKENKDETVSAGKLLENLWPEVVHSKSAPMIAHTAEAIGELYKTLAHQVSEKSRQRHLMRAIQFYQKANGIWLELENPYYLKRVQERTPRL